MLLVVSLSIFLGSSVGVSANEIYDDYELDENGDVIWEVAYIPALFNSVSWEIQSQIEYTKFQYKALMYNGAGAATGTQTGNLTFGSSFHAAMNYCSWCQIDIYNDGVYLFKDKGTLYLKVYSYVPNYANNTPTDTTAYVLAKYSTGEEQKYLTGFGGYYDLTIPNDDGTLISLTAYTSSLAVREIYLGFQQYGYEVSAPVDTGVETSKNILELLQNFIGGFWNNVTSSISNVFKFLSDFVSGFWNNLSNKFGELVGQIAAIFIPDDVFLQSWTQEVTELVQDKLGALGWVAGYFTNFFNDILQSGYGEPVLTIPEISIDIPNYGSYLILEETEYNFNSVYEHFPFLESILKFATSLLLGGLFIMYCQHALGEFFKSNGGA